jgi:hypothetical protein
LLAQDCSLVTFFAKEEDKFRFELLADYYESDVDDKWVAVGLSSDAVMGGDAIVACFVGSGGQFHVDNFWNFDKPKFTLPVEVTFRPSRVARWRILKPKIPIWVNFGGSCNGRCWYIIWPFGLFYGCLVCLWPFDIFYGYLVYFSRYGMLYQEKSGHPASIHSSSMYWCLVF